VPRNGTAHFVCALGSLPETQAQTRSNKLGGNKKPLATTKAGENALGERKKVPTDFPTAGNRSGAKNAGSRKQLPALAPNRFQITFRRFIRRFFRGFPEIPQLFARSEQNSHLS
jgi:hypothetical protein